MVIPAPTFMYVVTAKLLFNASLHDSDLLMFAAILGLPCINSSGILRKLSRGSTCLSQTRAEGAVAWVGGGGWKPCPL